MSEAAGQLIAFAILLLASPVFAAAQIPTCYAGFEISQACINERGLAQKVAAYQRKITEAMLMLGASYKIDLRVVNDPTEAGYDAATVGDVFIEQTAGQSFIINVTAGFLEKQSGILFEASSLHEICHVMNDDLAGYHRNGANIEVAEEHCVLQAVGESRYMQFLQAYAAYRHWDTFSDDKFLQRVKNTALVAAPRERDEADRIAAEYLGQHANGKKHLLVYNGVLHDETLSSTKDTVWHDDAKLKAAIKAGKPIVFFQNHPPEGGRAAMFPGYEDFELAALLSFMVYAENPNLEIEFRVMQLGIETTIMSYGFKGTAVEDIKKVALEYRSAIRFQANLAQIELRQKLLDYYLAQESFNEYLQYACPWDPTRTHADVCRTYPQYFIWPSDRFFVHYRPQ